MTSSARRAWWILAVAGVVAALGASPGAAVGAITPTSATIDGVVSTSSPAGSVMNATVKATVASTTWRATEVQFGSQRPDCIDHDNRSVSGSETFKVTAPGTPGNYDVGFQPNDANDCKGTPGGTLTLANGLRVTEPAPNKDLPPRCGINVMVVLDKSGSIQSSGATEKVRNATRAFLGSLSGTGAKVSIVDFSTSAARPVDYTTVTAGTIGSVFEPYLVNDYKPNGWTNWEDAFQEVREANAGSGRRADLVVFITDGDPTARNDPPGNPVTNLTEGDVTAMRRAAVEADLVKGQGSHVFAVGVGSAVTKEASARRLTAISGFDEFPGASFSEADYTLVQDFDDLEAALRKIATELCEASVTVTKLVDEGDGRYRPDPGWKFSATVSTDPGGYAWVQPPPPTPAEPRSQVTDDNGVASFQWKPSNSTATSTVTLDETRKPGYAFVDVICTKNAPRRRAGRRIRRTSEPVTALTLKPNEYYRCTARNRIKPGTIEIEKEATPQSSQAFPFGGSFAPFKLVDDGKGASSSRIFSGLAPGRYTVRELVPENWELTGVTCTPAAPAEITGTEVAITIAPGGSVVCSYRDRRVDPPVPPEPPEPPVPPIPPAPPSPPQPLAPPTPPPSTQLRVVKTAPRLARVGARVRFKLTVTNTGSVAATNVQLLDVPPAALTLTALRSTFKARVVRGNAVWRLGTLAPGAKRSVRGSVRVKAGSAGLKRNLAVATAVNAQLVSARADTRVLARRSVPDFTG